MRAPMTTAATSGSVYGPSALELRSVGLRYGSGTAAVHALDDVSITVDRGEFVAVMGPSGSGKSTLIHVAAGLVRPTAGEVIVEGQKVSPKDRRLWAKLRRRTIGVVFQRLNLVPTLTAIENVMVPLILDGRSQRLATSDASDALSLAGLDGPYDRFPTDMSGGEQQRVAVARALVGERSVLLADEPTGALDTATSDRIVELLAHRARAGTSVVMVTHDSRLASWADRVVYLQDGKVLEGHRSDRVKDGSDG